MGNITQLKQGSLNGLYRQTNECLDSAYSKGFEDGNKIADKDLKEIQDSTYDVAYNKGVEDFENLFVHEHDYELFFEDTYGSKNPDYNLYDLVAKYGAKKVINDFEKWQEKKKKAEEEIRVGDIIYSDLQKITAIITRDNGMSFECIDTDGFGFSKLKDRLDEEWVKVGHTDELSQLFDKLRGTKIG